MDTFEKLYGEDQSCVQLWEKNYTNKEFFKIHRKIRKKLDKLMINRKLSGREYFICAMIYHHEYTISSSKKALRNIKIAQSKGYNKQKWLIASIEDRLLQLQGRPQKYGTQLVMLKNRILQKSKDGKYIQYKVDNSVTDKERASLGLPKLKNLKKYLEK
ncbi:MAG: hypothetical protein AABW81_04530 [Nanoarchaeota archaeon]